MIGRLEPQRSVPHASLAQPAGDAGTRRLLIIGDSTTLGAAEVLGNDVVRTVSPSYVELLRDAFPGLSIEADADVHRTTSDVRNRIDAILAARRPDLALLQLGANDADMDWRRFVLSDGKVARSRVPLERYQANLRQIAEKLIAAGATPILCDLLNHDLAARGPYISKLAGKDVTAMLERGGGQSETNKYLALYRRAADDVARDLNLEIVRYGHEMDRRAPRDVLSPDGAHPSVGGHRVIFEAMAPVLRRITAARSAPRSVA